MCSNNFTGCAQQRHALEHRQRDVHGHGAAQPRAHELLAANARLLELRPGKLQASSSAYLQRRALKHTKDRYSR